jgi:hypothetical protein
MPRPYFLLHHDSIALQPSWPITSFRLHVLPCLAIAFPSYYNPPGSPPTTLPFVPFYYSAHAPYEYAALLPDHMVVAAALQVGGGTAYTSSPSSPRLAHYGAATVVENHFFCCHRISGSTATRPTTRPTPSRMSGAAADSVV